MRRLGEKAILGEIAHKRDELIDSGISIVVVLFHQYNNCTVMRCMMKYDNN